MSIDYLNPFAANV